MNKWIKERNERGEEERRGYEGGGGGEKEGLTGRGSDKREDEQLDQFNLPFNQCSLTALQFCFFRFCFLEDYQFQDFVAP